VLGSFCVATAVEFLCLTSLDQWLSFWLALACVQSVCTLQAGLKPGLTS
jgi:hypothetical protein